MLRIYACLLAVVLALMGVAAFFSKRLRRSSGSRGEHTLSVSSAAIVAYVGLLRRDPDIVRIVVGGMGVLLLLTGLLLAIVMSILGFPYKGGGWEVGLGHAALGALTMACAVLLPCADAEPPTS